uniref:Mediator of RNA polymerase II transcription subunit 23 n=1 Tax=Panagrolaimus superbus TaxID=310955 RepID=A0A914XY81_9BILA
MMEYIDPFNQPEPFLASPEEMFPIAAAESEKAVYISREKELQHLIVQHLTDPKILTMRKMFASVAKNLDCRDVLIAESNAILCPLTPEKIMECVCKVASQLKLDKRHWIIYDDALTDIIIGLHDHELLTGHYTLMLLIRCNDLRIAINKKKEKYIKTQLAETSYKSMREVLKCIFVEMNKLSVHSLNEQQFNNLRPFEEILLGMLDRNNAKCPPILIVNEISRLHSSAPIYMFKRFCDAAENIVNSFRPLGVICEIIGHPFLFPLFLHPRINFTHQWLLEGSTKLPSKSFLPRSTYVQAPQTFLKYILLKQPRLFVFDENVSPFDLLFKYTLYEVTECLLILILEAMAAMEETERSFEDPLNQYNWQHISDMCAYSLVSGRANFNQLLENLVNHLSQLRYRKARGELMRVILQYISVHVSAAIKASSRIEFTFYPKLVELYNLLYHEDTSEVSTSAEQMKLVRFFAPTAIWLNLLAVKNTDVVIEPPPKLVRYVNFIENFLTSNSKAEEEGFITVIANSYTGRPEIFQKYFCEVVYREIQKPFNNHNYWQLAYGKSALNGGKALDVTLLSSLSFNAGQTLFKYLQEEWNQRMDRNELPSPGLIETIARMTFMGDFKGSIKSMVNIFLLKVKQGLNLPHYHLLVLSEFFTCRLKVINDYSICPIFVVKTYALMTVYCQQYGAATQRYACFEHQFLRIFCHSSPFIFIQCIKVMMAMATQKQEQYVPFTPVTDFGNGKTSASAEVSGLILLQYYRTYKLTMPSLNNQTSSELEVYDNQIIETQTIPAKTKQWIPEKFQGMKVSQFPTFSHVQNVLSMIDQDIYQFTTQNERHFRDDGHHRILLLLFYLVRQQQRPQTFPHFGYVILNNYNSHYIISATNVLVDYIISQLKEYKKSGAHLDEFIQLRNYVNEFIFYHNFINFDRFLFQLVTHPNDDESIYLMLEFIKIILCDNSLVDERLNFLIEVLPSYYDISFFNSQIFFMGIKEYYDRFPEPSYFELFSPEIYRPDEHLPIYYSNLMEKLIPIVDHIFHRAIEQELPGEIFFPLINRLAVVYKYHPTPAATLYRMLFPFPPELIRKDSVREMVRRIAILDPKHPHYILSDCFLERFHISTVTDTVDTLIYRVSNASNYKHEPPEYCCRDWRFAEMSPGAAVLTGANIELMVGKFTVAETVDAFMEFAFKRPVDKPYETLNTISLILTTLPLYFQENYVERQLDIIEFSELIEDDDPRKMLETFSKDAYTASENRPLAALALLHGFLQHCSVNSLQLLVNLAEKLQEKVKTESQLFFVVRFVTPFFTRIEDIDAVKHRLCVVIYQAIANCIDHKGRLAYEDVFCDLLFYIKYSVSGYLLKEKVEGYMTHFPPEMLEKLRFLHSAHPGDTLEAEAPPPQPKPPQAKAPLPHILLQHQPSQQHMAPMFASLNVPLPGNTPSQQDSRMMQNSTEQPGFRESGQFMDTRAMPEMVGPPFRADTLPEYQPTLIRHQDMSPMQQQYMSNSSGPPGMVMQRMPPPGAMRMQGIPGGQMSMNPMHHRFGPGMMPPNSNPAMMSQMMSPHYMQNAQGGPYMNPPGPSGGYMQGSQVPSMSESGMMPPNYGGYHNMGPQGQMMMMNQGGMMQGGPQMGGMMQPSGPGMMSNQGQMMGPGYGFAPPPGPQQMRPNMSQYSMPPR